MLRKQFKRKRKVRTAFRKIKKTRRGLVSRGSSELGYVDKNVNSVLDTTGGIQLLATIPQGTSIGTRIGKKIKLHSIQMRGFIANNSTAAFNDVAYIVVYDKRPTSSLPAITDILDAATPYAMNNDNNAGRFVILKRVDAMLIGNTGTPETLTTTAAKGSDWYLNLKGRMMEFASAGTGAIGDITTGALYLITVGSNAAGTSAAALSGNCRVKFVDV